MKVAGNDTIPSKWASFRKTVLTMLSTNHIWKQQPIVPLSTVQGLASEHQIYGAKHVVAMLRFFHSQGVFLWYEDLPEMKDVVIVDPQWFSDNFALSSTTTLMMKGCVTESFTWKIFP